MFCCGQFFTLGSIIVVGFLAWKIRNMFKVPPLPKIDRNTYWGPGKPPAKEDTSIRPFTVKFEPEMIEDLKDRLKRTRYTAPLEDVGCQYGFNHDGLKEVVKYWSEKYDFADREKFLNQYPQFKTIIQGLDIHFIHIKPEVPKNIRVLPMLMLHGWPGSVVEFYKIIPLLTKPREDADFVFELIIPSLPGYGFSQAASKKGLGAIQIAALMVNLMERLNHQKFFIQGGDWGGIITNFMATLFEDKIIGFHTNFPMNNSLKSTLRMLLGSLWPSMFVDEKYAHKFFPISKRFSHTMLESGYFHIQATKPDSVGAGLGDSPAGLAAYILEKFSTATDPSWRNLKDAGLTQRYSYTDLIDNLMVYWVSNSATTAVRLYAESFDKKSRENSLDSIPTSVPTAVARFPLELSYLTDSQLRDKYPNLVQATDMPRGGHFAAFEEPKLLADDVVSAVKKFEAFHKKSQ